MSIDVSPLNVSTLKTTDNTTESQPLSVIFTIPHTDSMLYFGRVVATLLLTYVYTHPILLYGDVGCGKTTFIRGLVNHFPKSSQADVSSPSFTTCNHYPTEPQILHYDLYRNTHTSADELYEIFYNPLGILLIEWAEHIPLTLLPKEYLNFSFNISTHDSRQIHCIHYGSMVKTPIHALIENQKTIQKNLEGICTS